MIQIDKTLVSEDLIDQAFVCDLSRCKGACCVQGAYGAPLEEEETKKLEEIAEAVRPFLNEKGLKALDEQGPYVKGVDGDWETPLVNGEECAYTIFDEKGTALCGIEKAHQAGAIDWLKPVSCHLYPVRVTQYSSFAAVNYHRWDICDPACQLGDELQMPIYKFVKKALIRRFGEQWYAELEEAAEAFKLKGS
ncbi:DUF3109 family protein [Aureicoccus marinus]|uniref:DUF3109 domain-containing protein n=1 Tax=Aureicoccus marinus TaxID=754435 RepID=A0A2S7T9B8_9FLAO|nr:DUF3109 family protein [Aureicoccus marinus]PQJ16066.1 hypothetical protein BST99_10325 [Aureicoccus marinus]